MGAPAGGRGPKKQSTEACGLGFASCAFSLAEAGVWVVILSAQIIWGSQQSIYLAEPACQSLLTLTP